MHDDDDIVGSAIELLVDSSRREQSQQQEIVEKAQLARIQADAARLALAELAAPSVAVIALRLSGTTTDWDGRPITKDREDTAWEVLSRIGVPKLRATAVAASIAAHTAAPAPGAPGWEPPELDEEDEDKAIDVASVDSQIEAFLAGADVAKKMRAESKGDEAA